MLKRVLVLLDAELVRRDAAGFLIPDIFGDGGLVQADRRDMAAFGPKMPVAELALQARMPVKHHKRALALEVSHEAGHAHLRRHAGRNMHVARHRMPFDDLGSSITAESSEYLA